MDMRTVIPLALSVVVPILGQTTLGSGAAGGTVRDASGGVVADAKVTLTEGSKGLVRESQSDRGGSFLFPALIAGVYSIRVEKNGFNTQEMDGLLIEVGQWVSVAITLTVGDVVTSVRVAAPTLTELSS